MMNTRTSDAPFIAVAALVFLASAALTIIGCASMAAMPGMPMPGGWTMSMAWMRMPEQTWFDATAMFIGMWVVMMIAMMLPALVPMLMRYRRSVGLRASLDRLTMIVGAGYFFVWILCGLAAFALGIALAQMAMSMPALARVTPLAGGAVVVIAGILQFTAWKSRQLDCCRAPPTHALAPHVGIAWRYGLRLGIRCVRCCLGLTAVLLVIGVMDLWSMALVAVAITAERLAPTGRNVARGVGALTVVAGLMLASHGFGASTRLSLSHAQPGLQFVAGNSLFTAGPRNHHIAGRRHTAAGHADRAATSRT